MMFFEAPFLRGHQREVFVVLKNPKPVLDKAATEQGLTVWKVLTLGLLVKATQKKGCIPSKIVLLDTYYVGAWKHDSPDVFYQFLPHDCRKLHLASWGSTRSSWSGPSKMWFLRIPYFFRFINGVCPKSTKHMYDHRCFSHFQQKDRKRSNSHPWIHMCPLFTMNHHVCRYVLWLSLVQVQAWTQHQVSTLSTGNSLEVSPINFPCFP